jgi:hypothetical protein
MVGMPKSIQRGFIVGDRHFLTYDEARTYAADNKVKLQRFALMTFLDNLNLSGLSESDIEDVAAALLESYEIKPKKRND